MGAEKLRVRQFFFLLFLSPNDRFLNVSSLNEGSDAVLKRLLGVGLQRGEIPINPRLRQARPSEDQREPTKGFDQLKTAWKFRKSHGDRGEA